MLVYIAIFVFLLIVSLGSNKWKWLFLFVFVFLVLFAGFRNDNVGVDTYEYRLFFNFLSRGYYISWLEPGWVILNIVISKIGGNFLELLTIVSFLTLLPVFYVVKKNSPYIFFSLFVFYGLHIYCGAFNLMRQYLAISITFLAYFLFERGKQKTALLTWLFACSFHYSCILAVIVFFFNKVHTKIDIKYFLVLIFCAFAFGSIVNRQIIDIVTFSEYTAVAKQRENVVVAGLLTIAVDIFMLTIAYTSKPKLLNSFWGRLFVLSIVVFNATYTLYLSARIYSLFAISQVIFLPLYIKYSTIKNKLIPILFVGLYVSVQFWRMYLTNGNNILPYQINVFDLKLSIFRFFV